MDTDAVKVCLSHLNHIPVAANLVRVIPNNMALCSAGVAPASCWQGPHVQALGEPLTPPRQQPQQPSEIEFTSPTAGLRMLSSLASPHGRHTHRWSAVLPSQAQTSSGYVPEQSGLDVLGDQLETTPPMAAAARVNHRPDSTPPSDPSKVIRKEKSLGLLSDNFLNMYNGAPGADISLDIVAVELGRHIFCNPRYQISCRSLLC